MDLFLTLESGDIHWYLCFCLTNLSIISYILLPITHIPYLNKVWDKNHLSVRDNNTPLWTRYPHSHPQIAAIAYKGRCNALRCSLQISSSSSDLSSRIAIRLASFTWAGRHELDHASLDWMPCDEVGPLRALGGIWLIGHPSVIRTFRTFWGIRLRRFNQFRGVHLACLQCVPKSQLISDRGACEKLTKPIQEVSNLDFGLSLGSLLPRVKKGWFFWAINPSRKKSIFWSPNVQWSKLLISLQLSLRDVTAVVCG